MDLKSEMMLANLYRSAENRALKAIKSTDVRKDDGLFYCSVCDEPVQYRHDSQNAVYTLSRQCRCDREEALSREKDRTKQERLEMVEILKRRAFQNFRLREHTFKNDDGRSEKTSEFCQKWVKNYERMKDEGIGIMFFGDVGTGKSYFAAAIVNAVMEQYLVSAKVIDMNVLLNKVSSYETKQATLDELDSTELLVIDDFGTTRDTEYAWEQIYTIINNRVRLGKPLIITTNLAPSLFAEQNISMDQRRVFDRILEICPLEIKLSGGSGRRKKASKKVDLARKIMNEE